MSIDERLRQLPSVDAVLRSELMGELIAQHGQRRVAQWVRSAVDRARQQLRNKPGIGPSSLLPMVLEDVKQLERRDCGQSVRRVINATGVVLHTNLGRAPLAAAAAERVAQATGYASVELDTVSGRRSRRGGRCTELLVELTGAESAAVVNNCAAATMLVLQAIAAGREVIVSRGQLVEIGGGFRLPDVFRAAGVTLREIGTTNRTYLHDYEAAIGSETAAIIRVHRSNFFQSGFVTEPGIEALTAIDRPDEIPVIDDLGSGCSEAFLLPGSNEPTVRGSVIAGADLTLFSGDKLFGGPQAGIIVGRRRWVERINRHPMMRALRPDKLTLAALEATVEIYLRDDAATQIPVLRIIGQSPESIAEKCRTVCEAIAGWCDARVIASQSQIGGGSAPGTSLASFAVEIRAGDVERLARALRTGAPAVQPRVTQDTLLLDLRTVGEDELAELIERLRNSLASTMDSGQSE